MKILTTIIIILCLWLSSAEAGLLNEYTSFKEFVNELGIKNGVFYDFEASNWEHIVSGSIYDFYYRDFSIASIEAAYMVQDIALGIATFNIPGLAAFGWTLPLGELKPKVGIGAGYDFRHHDPVYGLATLGFTWTF